MNFKRQFEYQHFSSKNILKDEIDVFLQALEEDHFDSYLELSIDELENYFYRAIDEYDLIGEFPISEKIFDKLTDKLVPCFKEFQAGSQTLIPATLFAIAMVFSARYSKHESRNFWTPFLMRFYPNLERTQSLQKKNKDYFVKCREYLSKEKNLNFDIRQDGDAVRPAFQHAILPFYIINEIAEYLVNSYDDLVRLPEELLRQRLKESPPKATFLKNYLQDEDTAEIAADLFIKMINLIRKAKKSENFAMFELLISSKIELSLWQEIKKIYLESEKNKSKLQTSGRLNWVYTLDDKKFYLELTEVISQTLKPKNVVWIGETDKDLRTPRLNLELYPWRSNNKGWELEKTVLRVIDSCDGKILVVSDDFSFLETIEDQTTKIIFEQDVPVLDCSEIFFKIDRFGKKAVKRAKLDSFGNWIIFSKKDLKILDEVEQIIPHKSSPSIPTALKKYGYCFSTEIEIKTNKIKINDQLIHFRDQHNISKLPPELIGERVDDNLSASVPILFKSSEIQLKLFLNQQTKINKLRFELNQVGENPKYLTAEELEASDLFNNSLIVNLNNYLNRAGRYSIDIYYELKSLIDSPIEFGVFPSDITVAGPSQGQIFTPINPVSVMIQGAKKDQIFDFFNQEIETVSDGDVLEIRWNNTRDSFCGFLIEWGNSNFQLCWNVNRIAAWAEDQNSKPIDAVDEVNLSQVRIKVRGKSNQEYYWIINSERIKRRESLPSTGKLTAKLEDLNLREQLKSLKQIFSTVEIEIDGTRWKVLDYRRNFLLAIKDIKTKDDKIFFSIESEPDLTDLIGSFQIGLIATEFPGKFNGFTSEPIERLATSYEFPFIFESGSYRIEIRTSNKLICQSGKFEFIKESSVAKFLSEFEILTAPKKVFQDIEENHPRLSSIIRQLKIINTHSEWLTDEDYEKRFKLHLPAWAVTANPFHLILESFGNKKLTVYPKFVYFGGKAGYGRLDFTSNGEKIIAAAYWDFDEKNGNSLLRFGIPDQNSKIEKIKVLDSLNLSSVYICNTCYKILPSIHGKLSQRLLQEHQHGERRNFNLQFFDALNEPIKVKIKPITNQPLYNQENPSDVAPISLLETKHKITTVKRPLNIPIDLNSYKDFNIAVTELKKNLESVSILKITENNRSLQKTWQFFDNNQSAFPSFCAFLRLSNEIKKMDKIINIPNLVLTLAMALRLKSYNQNLYTFLLRVISEEKLKDLAASALAGCPKLLEWATAWAEIFYIHAISVE